MTAPNRGVPGEDSSGHTEFHGPTAIQGGSHSVQNNHFHSPARGIGALPWSKIIATVKEKGPSVVVMLGLISGGSWWLHDHLAQQSRLDATRSACRQAQDAWSDHATAGTGSDKSMSIKIDRRYAQELSLAASSARDPKIARELRNDADDIKAFADAYERGTSDAMSAAWSADTHDHGLWWTDCTVVLNSK